MNNIFVLNKNYKKIGTLSNQGAKPQAPYYNDLYTQELDTGADTYQFSTVSNAYTQDCIEIGNHIMFSYKNRNELFTITSIEYSHSEGYKTIGVYAEGIGFELLEIYMKKPDDTSSDDEGGRDEDNDGDTSTDDEYADLDDMYLDENGIIIYDKDGSGPPKEEDMYVDGNGIIVYKRSKNNRKNDSLEFKNISYPTFLNILLKNTDWSFVCQPGLEEVKHDITVQYDRNIYAILQDSMQSYKGVELEFVFEYNNGKVQKTIKAYKDGGRGSFVGKRFEYGTNIKGITKTQKVANNEDDTVLYVDDVGIEVYYDVDFALKSAEVPEIEIGDTHYVIDTDFHPPMNIKARIGKIEVSFTDPTKNKIYLANNKKISGSAIEEEVNEDDIKDIMDDYDGDIGEHTHSYLENYTYRVHLSGNELTGANRFYNLGSETFPWNLAFTNAIYNSNYMESPRYCGYNYQVLYDREDMEDVTKITDSSNITKQDLLNFIMNDLNVYQYSSTEINELMNKDVDDASGYYNKQEYLGILSEDVVNHGNPCTISAVGNLISKGQIRGDTNSDGDQNNNDSHNKHTYNIPALLTCLIGAFQQHVAGYSPDAPSNPSTPGDSGGNFYATLYCEYLKVTHTASVGGDMWVNGELHIGNLDTGSIKCFDLETSDMGSVTTNNINANRLYVDSIEDVDYITFKDSDADIRIGIGPKESMRVLNIDLAYGKLERVKEITFSDGSTLTSAKGVSGGGSGNPGSGDSGGNSGDSTVFDTITVTKIQGPDPGEGQYNRVQFEDGICVDHIWCASEDSGAIHMQDELVLHNGFTMTGDLEVADGNIHANEIYPLKIVFPDGSELTTASDSGSSSGSGPEYDAENDKMTVSNIQMGAPITSSDYPNDMRPGHYCPTNPALSVNGDMVIKGKLHIIGTWFCNGNEHSDISLKENIRYIDNTGIVVVDKENLETRNYYNEDLIESTDLYDFIVNQVNVCEYNFIDSNKQKIGFIANEYEGTKVGDKIVFRDDDDDLLGYDPNNLLFATIGALQEEVRIKDEQIASLEDRLARIEAMLGINNDN